MNRIVAVVAAVLILAGAGYFIFIQGAGDGDRVTGEELRSYIETQFSEAGATMESVTYEEGNDTVTVTGLDWGDAIPFYKDFKIAKLEIQGGDKRAFELIFDEAAATQAADGDWRRMAKRASAENITFSLDFSSLAKMGMADPGDVEKALGKFNAVATVESSTVENFAVKSTGEPWSALLNMPEMNSPEAVNSFMATAGKFAAAQKYGRNEAKGIKYRFEAEEFSLEVNVDSVVSGGYDAGVLKKTEMGPMTVVVGGEAIQEEMGDKITISMDSAMIESMDMADMLVAMQDGKLLPEDPQQAPMLNPWAPTIGDFKISAFKAAIPGVGDFTMDELYANDVKHVAGLMLEYEGGIKNLVIPASAVADSGAKPVMDALGAEELRINVSSKSSFDEDKNVWEMSEFLVDVDKFGSLDTQFRFGGMGFLKDLVGMTAGEFAEGKMQGRVLQEMTFARLQLTYRDHGAADYMLNSMAEQSGVERDQLAEQYVQQFDAMRAQFGESEALDDLSGALGTFLKEPKSLRLTFEPKEPVPLGQLTAVGMAAPAQLVETLGFSVEANK